MFYYFSNKTLITHHEAIDEYGTPCFTSYDLSHLLNNQCPLCNARATPFHLLHGKCSTSNATFKTALFCPVPGCRHSGTKHFEKHFKEEHTGIYKNYDEYSFALVTRVKTTALGLLDFKFATNSELHNYEKFARKIKTLKVHQ